MFIRRLVQGVRRQDWSAVLIEVFVVMIGLLIAFQVDRWWELRRGRISEKTYVSRLISEVAEDIPKLDYAIGLAEVRLALGDILVDVGADPSAALTQPGAFLAAVAQAAFTYTPPLATNTFEDLLATGNLKLIRDPDVKRSLHEYYSYDESQRQFISLNLMIEFRYFELSADIITIEQYKFVQDRWYIVNPDNIEEVRGTRAEEASVRAAADRLSRSKELLAWLPKVRGLQVDQIVAHGDRLKKAQSLVNVLEAYQARLGD